MLSPSALYGTLSNGALQALSATATATLAAAGNRLLPRIPHLGSSCNSSSTSSSSTVQQTWVHSSMQAYRGQHSMVQEDEGLPEHVQEDPRLAKIEAVRKKVGAWHAGNRNRTGIIRLPMLLLPDNHKPNEE